MSTVGTISDPGPTLSSMAVTCHLSSTWKRSISTNKPVARVAVAWMSSPILELRFYPSGSLSRSAQTLSSRGERLAQTASKCHSGPESLASRHPQLPGVPHFEQHHLLRCVGYDDERTQEAQALCLQRHLSLGQGTHSKGVQSWSHAISH